MPAMEIQKNGHKLGTTPISFNQPGSNYPIVLRADWVERRYYKNMRMVEVPRTLVKIVFPNDTQAIDFNGFTAK